MIKIDKTKTLDIRKKVEFKNKLDNSHAYNVEYLMQNESDALRLHIDNLVLTYGIQAVRNSVNKTNLDLIKKYKKVG